MNAPVKTPPGQPKLTPVSGPACWKAAELEARSDWIHSLSGREIVELETATEALSGRPLETITREEFALPELGKRLAVVRDGVLNGVGIALLRGLPVTGRDEQAVSRMLWGIGLHLGQAQPQDAAGALLHHVRDTGVKVAGRDDVRTFETNEAQPWHNDGGDVFALLCRDIATSGGRSYVASTYSLFNALLEQDAEIVRTLQADFHFDTRGQSLPGRGPVQSVPVFIWHAGKLFMLHKRHYIELAQRFDEVPRLTDAQIKAINAIETICDDPQFHLAFELAPGDVEIANNFAVLHKRGAFDQDATSTSRRHMLRLWLGMHDGWPLPEAFRDTREYASLFSVRLQTGQ